MSLLSHLPDSDPLQLEAISLVSDLDDLGVLSSYGSACFFIAALLSCMLNYRSIRNSLLVGYAAIRTGAENLALGLPAFTRPGQAHGHAFCLVDDRVIFDFGLGAAGKYLVPGFPVCMAAPVIGLNGCLAQGRVDEDLEIQWFASSEIPGVSETLRAQQPLVDAVFKRWRRRHRRRLQLGNNTSLPSAPNVTLATQPSRGT